MVEAMAALVLVDHWMRLRAQCGDGDPAARALAQGDAAPAGKSREARP
jgi:hypothetical protein